MAPEIRLLPGAERDLATIQEYTSEQWGTRQAERYLRGLRSKLGLLATHPEMSPPYRPSSSIRMALYESHRIFYRRVPGGIEVGRVIHQAQRISRALQRYAELQGELKLLLSDDP